MVTDRKHNIKYDLQSKEVVDLIWQVRYKICQSISEHIVSKPHESAIKNMLVYDD